MNRIHRLRHLALCTLVLLIACGRAGGTAENLDSSIDKIVDPGSGNLSPPPPPATLGWPSPPVIGSETTGTLPGEGSVGVAGDYRYTLPIEVPPGRAGMAPELSLSYSSAGENGIAGVGWGLAGASAVRICNKTFATDGTAREDEAWCLDGQRLVPSGEDAVQAPTDLHNGVIATISQWRTESDTFARIEKKTFSSKDSLSVVSTFRVLSRDGRIRTYTSVDAEENERLLAKEEDRFGNTITYEYKSQELPAMEDLSHPAPIKIREETTLLTKITYTGRASSGELGTRWVELTYEDRPDPSFATDKVPVTSSKKRLKTIDCYAPTPGTETHLAVQSIVWSYTLNYTVSPTSGHSILKSVKRSGPQNSAQLAKEFDWSSTKGGVYESPNFALPQRDTAGELVVLDVDHDGRDELLYSPPGLVSAGIMYSTLGAGQPLLQLTQFPLATGLWNATFVDASVGDIDGDGVPEIIAPDRNANAEGVKAYEVYKWSPATKDYTVTTQGNRPWSSYLDAVLSDNTEQPIFLVDMDGDGLVDMIQAQHGLTAYALDTSCAAATTPDRPRCLWYDWYYFHNKGGTFGPAQVFAASTPSAFLPPRSGSPFSASVHADRAGRSEFSGISFYGIQSGQGGIFAYKIRSDESIPTGYYSTPEFHSQCVYGNFTGRGEEPVCDVLPAGWRSTIFDFDGDGRDEIFQYSSQTLGGNFAVLASKHVYFDLAGDRKEDYPLHTPLATGDFNGDGFQDAIFYDQALGMTYAALSAGLTRDLMVGVRDETTAKPMETVQYSQSWSADPVTAKPCIMHPEHCLRQGMNVVVERDVYQGSDIDTYEHTFYNYEDPREDVHGRGFLGFTTVRSWNPDRLSETITEYDNQSSVNGIYFAFMPSRVSRYTAIAPVGGSHRQYTVRGSVVNSRYAVDRPTPSSYFRHPTTWDSVEWETTATIDMTVGIAKHFVFTGPAPTPLRERNGESSFDNYGNQTYSRSETVLGVKTEVIATYDNFPESWLIGELTRTLTTVTDPGNGSPQPRQVNYTYGSNGELKSSTIEETSLDAAIKYTTSFGYNSDGLLTSKTGSQPAFLSPFPVGDPLPPGDADRSVFIEYDPDEGIFPRKVWNDLGHVARMLYHPAFGAISDEISANGVETQVVFDGLGRARKITRAGESPVYIHTGPRTNAGGKLIGSYVDTTGAGVSTTHHEYDELGRLRLQSHAGFDGTGIFSETKYDGLGRVLFTSRSGFGAPAATGTTYAYDGLDRVVSVTPPAANVQPTRSAHEFFKTRTGDALNHESYTVRDVDGRVVESGDVGDGGVHAAVTLQYGNFNQLKTIVDSKNNISRIDYDQRGRRTGVHDPDAGTSTFHYNGFGDLTELNVPGIHGSTAPAQTRYTRDALGRIVHIDNGDGATDFTWDTSPYGIGLLASQSSKSVAQTFEYDWYGRPSRETWTIDNESFDVRTSYDGSGRVATVSYPEVPGRTRFTVQRRYASSGYLTSVEEIDLTTPVKFWEVLARNADDQLLTGQFGNGRLSKRAYEPTMGRLESIRDMACVGVNCVGADYALGYTYRDDGNVNTRTDQVTGRAETFGYDALNRLTSWDLTYGGSTRKTGYRYDDLGNLEDVTVGGVITESNTYYPSGGVLCSNPPCAGPHALQSATVGGATQHFNYDKRGRQVGAPERKVEFSEANLPTSIETAAGSTVFSYDAAGARVKKVGPSEETLTLGGLYERRVTSGGTQHVFFVSSGDGAMAQVTFAQRSPSSDRIEYLHTDALGSTGAVTDDTGNVTHLYHEPFGARVAADGSTFSGALGDVRLGFTGQVSDDDIDLVNMKGRIYSPAQRRFLSPDPLVSAPMNAQSYNRYSYVWNNPLNFTDPSGFEGAPPPPQPPPPPSTDHTTGGGPGNPGGSGGNWTAYHTDGGSKRQVQTQATPYKGSPAPGGSTGASSAHDANVHHDRMVALDLDRGNSRMFDKFVRSANAHEPGNGAANFGLVLADWMRTGVPPNGPELKVALNGAAGVVKQTAPLLQTTPAPVAPEPAPPVATTPPAVTGGASGEGPLLPRATHDNAHGFTIRDVNPTGNDMNCADCACAVDDLLAGKEPWAAPARGPEATDYNQLERALGFKFTEPMPLNDLLSVMDKAGPGARGIVFGIPDPQSGKIGHFFNVANQRDVVRLLDGQTGTAADPSRFERFRVMRTNP